MSFFFFWDDSTSTSNPLVTRNAVNLFGPGHSSGTGISTSTGATVSTTGTFVNNSGAPITIGSLAFAGWILTTTGTTATGNDVPVTADIEYPVGVTHNTMKLAGSSTITITNNSETLTDQVTLATPIPAGATFKVNISATQANGQKYIGTVTGTTGHSFGLCGVLTTALKSTLKKEMLFAVGDSIMTNNSGLAASVASYCGCPSLQMSISGTTVNTYGASSAANFTRQASIAGIIGATRCFTNFGTNDITLPQTAAQILANLGNLKTKLIANGVPKLTPCTIGPRVGSTTITASSATATGNTINIVVPDATKFDVGKFYLIAGANETGYNGNRICTAINTGTNTLTFPTTSGTVSPATGTVTLKGIGTTSSTSCHQLQSAVTEYAGSSGVRGVLNDTIRGGAFDGYVEIADSMETARYSNIWVNGTDDSGSHPELSPVLLCTTTSGTPLTATRFQLGSSYTNGTGTMSGGAAQFISGANIGETHGANGNTGGDYTSGVAFANIPTAGDQIYMLPGTSFPTDDGLHPRVAVNNIGAANYRGGQALIVNPTVTWLQGLLS